jgi:diaminopimelate epimerase
MEETGRDSVVVETKAGPLKARRTGPLEIAVDMGSPLLNWEDIPLAERMDTRRLDLRIGPIDNPVLHSPGAVNVGNPHCVFFVDDVTRYDVARIGSLLEAHPLFPECANIGFAEVRARDVIRLRVWERGAGLTLACGTGACAALVACHRRGFVDRRAELILDGGSLRIEWQESDDHVIMTGAIELEYEGDMA